VVFYPQRLIISLEVFYLQRLLVLAFSNFQPVCPDCRPPLPVGRRVSADRSGRRQAGQKQKAERPYFIRFFGSWL